MFFISQKKQKGVVNRIMIDREEMTRVTEHDAKKNTQNSILIYFAVYLTTHFFFQIQHKFILILMFRVLLYLFI